MVENVKKYWFLFSTFAFAVLLFLLDRKGRQFNELKLQVQRNELGRRLNALNQRSNTSLTEFERARDELTELKKTFPNLFVTPPKGGPDDQAS